MELTEPERTNLIEYLLAHTTYSKTTIYNIAADDNKLYSMTERIRECMSRYPKEILAYLEEHPEVEERYTLAELKQMRYNELVDIRQRFKIRKRRKKVTGAEFAKQTSDKARTAIKQNTHLEHTIFMGAISEPEDLEFLTPEELEMMYPGSGLYSESELHSLGVARENAHAHHEVDATEYYIKIATIVDSGLIVAGQTLTYQDCYNLPVNEVEKLYQMALAKTRSKGSKAKKKL